MQEMRRKEKEITDRKEIDEIIARAEVVHLAMTNGSKPYVVPLSFGYDGKNIYFHSANEGAKLDFIRKNPEVCFEFTVDILYQGIKTGCKASASYKCVIGWGRCEIVSDNELKKAAYDVIMGQYAKGKFEYTPAMLLKSTVVKIVITELKGKKS